MEDDYDEYRRWDGDVDVEVCFIKLYKQSPTLCILFKILIILIIKFNCFVVNLPLV